MSKARGKQSIIFESPVYIEEFACVAGQKEKEGPIGENIDIVNEDPMFGANTWEEAESELQKDTLKTVLSKAKLKSEDIRYIFAGDLIGQLIVTTFGVMDMNIPLFGVYGACSTMGESLGLSACMISAGFADRCIALASSHFACAEKQFRYPLEYGNQRPLASTWTVTGAGAVIVSNKLLNKGVKVTGITTGKIVDYGVKDSMNMGACMAPAAADLIAANFSDLDVKEDYYDLIITGDLGYVGKTIVLDLLEKRGINIRDKYTDCGILIYDKATQDTHSGGSGCGCSAVTLCAKILPEIINGKYKRVLFVPTGALLSPTSYNEGNSVPGIAHGVILEAC